MRRQLVPEILDDLPSTDPLAIGSRADLRRLNRVMGHARIIDQAFRRHGKGLAPGSRLRICELGAGDGSMLLELARRWSARGVFADAVLVDRQPVVTPPTQAAIAALGWSATSVESDVFAWLNAGDQVVDVMLVNLFLHHFEPPPLLHLLRLIAARSRLFIACEPRRTAGSLAAAHLVGLIGCNSVTRHDAVVSVRAGFRDRELSDLWPDHERDATHEGRGGLFSHCFVGVRHG